MSCISNKGITILNKFSIGGLIMRKVDSKVLHDLTLAQAHHYVLLVMIKKWGT